jgi:hypothetical protein
MASAAQVQVDLAFRAGEHPGQCHQPVAGESLREPRTCIESGKLRLNAGRSWPTRRGPARSSRAGRSLLMFWRITPASRWLTCRDSKWSKPQAPSFKLSTSDPGKSSIRSASPAEAFGPTFSRGEVIPSELADPRGCSSTAGSHQSSIILRDSRRFSAKRSVNQA